MTDNFMMPQSDPGLDSPKTLSARVSEVLSTSRGRMIAGGVGLVVMLALLAVVVFVFLLKPEGPALPPVVKASAVATTTPVGEAPPVNRPAKAISGEFAFRNIFEPTFVPAAEGDASGSTTDTAGGDGDDTDDNGANTNDEDTLYLVGVATVDGHPTGSFIWNGETYQAAVDEQLGDTPWSVEDIDGDTVTMLYGDSRVTLTVGQGLSK